MEKEAPTDADCCHAMIEIHSRTVLSNFLLILPGQRSFYSVLEYLKDL